MTSTLPVPVPTPRLRRPLVTAAVLLAVTAGLAGALSLASAVLFALFATRPELGAAVVLTALAVWAALPSRG